MSRPILDLDGQLFGKLIATNELRNNENGNERERLCYCECGENAWVKTSYLIGGYTKSCGCFRKTFRNLELGEAAKRQVWRDYTSNAAARNLKWELSEEDFYYYTQQNCHYCDRPPSTCRNARRQDDEAFVYNGIDRLDNFEGYLPSNIVSCCKICNRAKSNMTVGEFKEWIKDLVKVYYEDINSKEQ